MTRQTQNNSTACFSIRWRLFTCTSGKPARTSNSLLATSRNGYLRIFPIRRADMYVHGQWASKYIPRLCTELENTIKWFENGNEDILICCLCFVLVNMASVLPFIFDLSNNIILPIAQHNIQTQKQVKQHLTGNRMVQLRVIRTEMVKMTLRPNDGA